MPLALLAERERLVLDDRLQPREELARIGGRRLGEQDLDAALVGVLGVLRCGGVAARNRHELRAVALQQVDRRRVDLGARRPGALRPPG